MSDTEGETSAGSAEDAGDQGSVQLDEAFSSEDANLDQSEIDDLFDIGMDDEQESTGLDALVGSTHIQHRRLPLLEACFDRLLTKLSGNLRSFTWDEVDLTIADTTSVRFGDYIEAVPLPSLISVFNAVEWNGLGLIMIDSPLIYSMIDVLLGGRRTSTSIAIEGRSFTSIESALVKRIIGVILDDLSAAFEPLCEIAFRQERLESNPELAAISHPTSTAVVFKIDVDMSDRGGRIEVLIPDSTLEPVRNVLQQGFMGDKFGQDSVWEDHWIREMHLAETELEVSLCHQIMPVSEIMKLEVGSTLRLNGKPNDLVTLTSGRVPLMLGKVGRIGDTVAIQVDGWIAPSKREVFKVKTIQR